MIEKLVHELRSAEKFFQTSTRCLVEADSSFRPVPEVMSVAEQVAHAAQTIDWFMDAVVGDQGFDLDFEKHNAEVKKVVSLTEARAHFTAAMQRAVDVLESMTFEDLKKPFPPGPVLGNVPKIASISSICDHTAHHRGALTVYSRLLGKTPEMPYL